MGCRPAIFRCLMTAVLFGTATFAQNNFAVVNINTSGSLTETMYNNTSITLPGAFDLFGNATVQFGSVHPIDQSGNATGPSQITLGVFFNKLDSITFSGTAASGQDGGTFSANVTGGTGAYSGATGSASFTLTLGVGSNGNGVSLTGSGNVAAAQNSSAFKFQGGLIDVPKTPDYATDIFTLSGNGTVTSSNDSLGKLGKVTVTGSLATVQVGGQKGRVLGTVTFSFNSTDSFTMFLNVPPGSPLTNVNTILTGSTGAFAGATGNFAIVLGPAGANSSISGTGTITLAAAGAPIITSVTTASGAPSSSGNAWLEVKGTNLVPANTPAGGVSWDNAPEFASGQMPTQINGIGVKINNIAGYIYFYCSAATTPACASDQINVLAPLDGFYGPVPVVVTSPTTGSRPFLVNHQFVSPAFLLFNTKGYIAARHADYSLLGPTSLYPGATTPAKPLETILLYAVGFGVPTTQLTAGSSTQFGPLRDLPVCYIGNNQATVVSPSYLVSVGLSQLNVVVPEGTPSGDNLVTCSYQGVSPNVIATSPGSLLSVQ